MFSLRSAHVDFMHAHAHAENLHVHAHVNGVVQCQPWKSPTIYHRNVRREKTNARCPCTPQSTVETFGEEISAEACSGRRAGLYRCAIANKFSNASAELTVQGGTFHYILKLITIYKTRSLPSI